MKKTYLIAEIGINHNGSLKLAKKLIDLAKKYNFDAVKFQKRSPEISTPEIQKKVIRETPWGLMTYLDYKKKIEFGYKEFNQIDKYCKKIKIDWFVSCWDIQSIHFMKKYKVKFNKVASAMLTNLNFLDELSKQKKMTLISTGMSNMKDIEKAVKIFKRNRCKFALMHCVSEYPCADNLLNLNMIQTLRNKFKCPVGYSGHESTVSPSIIACALGADYLERHITIDRAMWGTDQAASLSEQGIHNLTDVVHRLNAILGNGKKKKTTKEKKMLKKFKYW